MHDNDSSPSPFAHPDPRLPIRMGAPPLLRPTKEAVERFPSDAARLWAGQRARQAELTASGDYDLSWLAGRHVLLAGATGAGLGGALATALMEVAKPESLTVLSRDLSRSMEFETGRLMEATAAAANWGSRFHWINDGMALEGPSLQAILAALSEAGAERVVYFNTVAAANSGLLPGLPPVFAKDVDETGLIQWQLTPLSEREIQGTSFIMGTMAVQFPDVLAANGVEVELSVFADWRGSIDHISRDPASRAYGRQGSYSTSLFLPKDIIQEAVRAAYGTPKRMIDIFYPMMRTRALRFIPGGILTERVSANLMRRSGVEEPDVPELALASLDVVGKAVRHGVENPFPRLDVQDAALAEWLFEISARITDDAASEFYYKKWM